MATIPQASIIQRPVAAPVQVPVPVRPIQTATIPYSNRTISTTSYRPSLQLQASNMNIVPYKQVTYRPNLRNTKMVQRPVKMRPLPVPVRTVNPVAPMPVAMPSVQSYRPVAMPSVQSYKPVAMPSVQSYRPVQPVALPTPVPQPQVVTRPPVAIASRVVPAPQVVPAAQVVPAPQVAMPTVRQVSTIPAQTAVVSQITTPRPAIPVTNVPVQPVPVQRVAPVQPVPVQRVAPVQPVPVQRVAPVQPLQVVRPPIATVTPVNVAPNLVRAPVQPIVQPLAQNMNVMRPPVYSANTYRPSVRRNIPGFTGYRPVPLVATNNLATPGGYTTRTYRPRKL
jgi:hypothetical protein